MTKILLVEDNPKHLADAKALLEDRVRVGAINGVDYATNLDEAVELVGIKTYDAIISDIFFPAEAGGIEEELGTFMGRYALDYNIPFVLITSTYHHGCKTQPACDWIRNRGMNLVDNPEADKWGDSDYKKWDDAYLSAMYLLEGIRGGYFIFTDIENERRGIKSVVKGILTNNKNRINFPLDKNYLQSRLAIREDEEIKSSWDEDRMKGRELLIKVLGKYCTGMFEEQLKK